MFLTRQVFGKLVGALLTTKSLDNDYVTALVISPDQKGKDLRVGLLSELEEVARAEGVTSITLFTKSCLALKQGHECYSSLVDVPTAGVTEHHFMKR